MSFIRSRFELMTLGEIEDAAASGNPAAREFLDSLNGG